MLAALLSGIGEHLPIPRSSSQHQTSTSFHQCLISLVPWRPKVLRYIPRHALQPLTLLIAANPEKQKSRNVCHTSSQGSHGEERICVPASQRCRSLHEAEFSSYHLAAYLIRPGRNLIRCAASPTNQTLACVRLVHTSTLISAALRATMHRGLRLSDAMSLQLAWWFSFSHGTGQGWYDGQPAATATTGATIGMLLRQMIVRALQTSLLFRK